MLNKYKYLILSIVFFIFFLSLSVIIFINKTNQLDTNVLNFFYNYRLEYDNFITQSFIKITFLFSSFSIVIYFIFLFIIIKNKKIYLFLLVSTVVAILLNTILKTIINRPRPDDLLMYTYESSKSFPSGHTFISTYLISLLIYYLLINQNLKKYLKIIFTVILILLIVAVGVSRMYLGVHFFTDVIAGLLLALFCMFLTLFVYKSLLSKNKFECR